jgi:hypothetical protein
VLLAAGCGSNAPSAGVASVGSTTSTADSDPAPAGGAVGGGGSGTASPSGPQRGFSIQVAGGDRADELKLSACMRSNGVPNFPDPNAQGVIQGSSSTGLNPDSAAFQAASRKCQKYQRGGPAPSAAQQAAFLKQALAYSACMRSHGEPSFPDPTTSAGGGVSLQIKAGAGSSLDPHSPAFQKAQKACQADQPGRVGSDASAPAGG